MHHAYYLNQNLEQIIIRKKSETELRKNKTQYSVILHSQEWKQLSPTGLFVENPTLIARRKSHALWWLWLCDKKAGSFTFYEESNNEKGLMIWWWYFNDVWCLWELKCIIKFGYQLFISQITTIKKKNIDD